MDNKNYAMTIKDVAKYLNISNQMVYNLIGDGELPAFKIGSASRIMFSDIEKYIERKKEEFSAGKADVSCFTVNNITVVKDDFTISDVSFSVPKGKILSILGSSGSGKTLLLKAIAGLIQIQNGEIYAGRTRFDNLESSKRHIGFVFENYALFPHMTGRKNIEFPLRIGKKSQKAISDETAKRVKELDIDLSYLETIPSHLPEGIKQLIAIARGKNHEFDLFIMDEPMSHLDAAHHVQMRMFLQKLVRDLHQTTIIAFNDPDDAFALSDYIAVMENGKLLQFGESWEIYHKPVSLSVMQVISSLGINSFPVEVINGKTVPFDLNVEKDNGNYIFAFRTEDTEIAEKGIDLNIESVQFLNAKKQIAMCSLKDKKTVKVSVLVPLNCKKEISILPKVFHVF